MRLRGGGGEGLEIQGRRDGGVELCVDLRLRPREMKAYDCGLGKCRGRFVEGIWGEGMRVLLRNRANSSKT